MSLVVLANVKFMFFSQNIYMLYVTYHLMFLVLNILGWIIEIRCISKCSFLLYNKFSYVVLARGFRWNSFDFFTDKISLLFLILFVFMGTGCQFMFGGVGWMLFDVKYKNHNKEACYIRFSYIHFIIHLNPQ